jgi:hypothetical protein
MLRIHTSRFKANLYFRDMPSWLILTVPATAAIVSLSAPIRNDESLLSVRSP